MEGRVTPVTACYKNSQGHKIINGYTLVNKLGQGSFGKVKVCTREGLQFAVKIFNKAILRRRREFMKNEKGGMKFHTALDDVMKEVEIMRRLTHKNVVRLVEVLDDSENDKLYLIVDLCAKGPLLQWHSSTRVFTCTLAPVLTDDVLRRLLRGMFLGLDYRNSHSVHYNCIAHRDIKPQNILVTSNDTVKICDFGQAMTCDSTDLTAKTVGTIQFFPPECCGGKGYAATSEHFSAMAADVWAMGLTLYAMVFKELPFFADTFLEVMEAIQRFHLTFSRPVSREIQYFLERLLDPNPRTRAKIWELIQHPWIAKPQPPPRPSSPALKLMLRFALMVDCRQKRLCRRWRLRVRQRRGPVEVYRRFDR